MYSWSEIPSVHILQGCCLILVVSGNRQCLYLVTNHLNVKMSAVVLGNKLRIQWSYCRLRDSLRKCSTKQITPEKDCSALLLSVMATDNLGYFINGHCVV